ncbi:MAG: hypothetical protein KC613_26410, partial [Myxococcales bacterium]|nr:hypothetical protein [Myxococcales bacterium]
RIFPFKIHRGKQPYDLSHKYLLIPKTFGADGFWGMTQKQQHTVEERWHQALLRGTEIHGLPYSGQETGGPNFGWAETAMYWPQVHMVGAADEALQCNDCHPTDGEPGRLDWAALGYPGDPAQVGGRLQNGLVDETAPFTGQEVAQ